ncbi:MAG: hypothetical protein LKJ83_01250 [Eubacteriaceae bacterium]|nr:hypothetical protein [Eubacteriaceae bacterium]
MKEKMKFYRVRDYDLIGKEEDHKHYLFRGGQWQEDNDNIISDRLHGFDSTADPDDPYGYGDEDMLERMEEITAVEASEGMPLDEVCRNDQMKKSIIAILKKYGLTHIEKEVISCHASIGDLKDNMGGGLPPDALFGIRDKIKEYYCSPANHDDRGMSIPEKMPEDVRLYEKGWPGLYLHQAVWQAKNAGIDKLAKAAETAVILKEWGATQEMVIAAILHSSLYGRPEEIAGIWNFYKDGVTSILSGLHFDKGRTWHQKMDEDFICAKESSRECRAIIMAELITELRELEKEFLDNGGILYGDDEERLSHEEYLSCLIDAFEDLQDDELWKDDYWIMQNLYKEIFVKYYISSDGNMLYQMDDLNCYAVMKGVSEYIEMDRKDFYFDACREITQERAEQIEEEWMPDIYPKNAADDFADEKQLLLSAMHGFAQTNSEDNYKTVIDIISQCPEILFYSYGYIDDRGNIIPFSGASDDGNYFLLFSDEDIFENITAPEGFAPAEISLGDAIEDMLNDINIRGIAIDPDGSNFIVCRESFELMHTGSSGGKIS